MQTPKSTKKEETTDKEEPKKEVFGDWRDGWGPEKDYYAPGYGPDTPMQGTSSGVWHINPALKPEGQEEAPEPEKPAKEYTSSVFKKKKAE